VLALVRSTRHACTNAQALLTAHSALRAAGHDLVAVCDLRSEPAAGSRGSAWRWRFLAACCPAEGADERARTTPYAMAGAMEAGAEEADLATE
jgi:hypothetical protein